MLLTLPPSHLATLKHLSLLRKQKPSLSAVCVRDVPLGQATRVSFRILSFVHAGIFDTYDFAFSTSSQERRRRSKENGETGSTTCVSYFGQDRQKIAFWQHLSSSSSLVFFSRSHDLSLTLSLCFGLQWSSAPYGDVNSCIWAEGGSLFAPQQSSSSSD